MIGFSLMTLVLAAVPAAKGETADAGNAETWDENATAESLGLEPLQLQDGFFPILPWGKLAGSDAMIGSLSECGFNMTGFIPADALPAAKQYSMKVILRFPAPIYTADEDVEEYGEKVKEALAPTKDDPDVIGYYLIDEPGADKFPALAVTAAAIKKHAPGKLAYINLFPGYASTLGADAVSQLGTWTYTEYLERYVQEVRPQFISYDNYMVDYSEDMTNAERSSSYWKDMLEVRRVAMKYKLPWWNTVSCLSLRPKTSPPTPVRFAFLAYTSLAAGCNGLSWYSTRRSPAIHTRPLMVTGTGLSRGFICRRSTGRFRRSGRSSRNSSRPASGSPTRPRRPIFLGIPERFLPI